MKSYSEKHGKLSEPEIIFSGIYIYVLIPTSGYNKVKITLLTIFVIVGGRGGGGVVVRLMRVGLM